MIGYYIHHHGRGHLSRATAIARELDEPVTGLSSLERPDDWPGEWVTLPLEENVGPQDAEANGRLHWVPIGDRGLRGRSAAVSKWIDAHDPALIVVDVSVEIALLARLHGVRVVVIALPGERTDPAHELGFDIATMILAAWPPAAKRMVAGVPAPTRILAVGAIGGRVSDPAQGPERVTSQSVVVLGGAGGDEFTRSAIAAAEAETPEWTWEHFGGTGTWVPDVSRRLRQASVVVTHAGEGALADVSAARVPAVVIPQKRPFNEQFSTATELLDDSWPAVVRAEWPDRGWLELLESARALDGAKWRHWNDGLGARRAAQAILGLVGERRA
ncbi:glycosyltransferase [Leucobacter sp. NPDC058333]|uniref:glycosyltransferase n=1 Tax=Leucobacter sp. NPDC058333 TaxID=3346450 RepID=UPI0036683709